MMKYIKIHDMIYEIGYYSLSSFEKNVKLGEVRIIDEIPFYVYMIGNKKFFSRKARVFWLLVDKCYKNKFDKNIKG